MSNIQWFVSYHVSYFNRDVISGPFATQLEATGHAQDISTYEGITHCFYYSENADELLDKSLFGN